LRGFAQGISEFLDGGVDAVVEFDDGIIRPQVQADFLAQHYLTAMLQQHGQDSERLFLQSDPPPMLAQLASANVEFERSEANSANERIHRLVAD
jgi:hypothetical protein